MPLDNPQDGPRRGHDFRIRPGHGQGLIAEVSAPPVSKGRVWLCAILSGLMAALVGWGLGERVNRSFHWEGRAQSELGNDRNKSEHALQSC